MGNNESSGSDATSNNNNKESLMTILTSPNNKSNQIKRGINPSFHMNLSPMSTIENMTRLNNIEDDNAALRKKIDHLEKHIMVITNGQFNNVPTSRPISETLAASAAWLKKLQAFESTRTSSSFSSPTQNKMKSLDDNFLNGAISPDTYAIALSQFAKACAAKNIQKTSTASSSIKISSAAKRTSTPVSKSSPMSKSNCEIKENCANNTYTPENKPRNSNKRNRSALRPIHQLVD